MSTPNPPCGVIAYRISPDGTLQGRWALLDNHSHSHVGSEVATGGVPGEITGVYRVAILNDDLTVIYRGDLIIEPIEASSTYRLRWKPGPDFDKQFEGTGFVAAPGLLAANYRAVETQ